MKMTESFQNQVSVFLSGMLETMPVREIETHLRDQSIVGSALDRDQFDKLFWAYFYAVVSQRWRRCCREHHIDAKEIDNLFFKTVLDRYAEQKDLDGAANFSEAMYASNSAENDEPLVSILAAYFKKLGVTESVASGQVVESFRWLAGVAEGYCNYFDNEFDDFLSRLRMGATDTNMKRGKHV